MKALIQEYVDGAASSDHDNHYKSNTLDQSSGIGNLSLTFPNYTTPIENQFRRVQPHDSKKVNKMIGYANMKNRIKPKSSGVSHRSKIRPNYRRQFNPNSHREMSATKERENSSDGFGLFSKSTGGSDAMTQTQTLEKTAQQQEIKELANKLESKQERILQRKLFAWPMRESTGYGEFPSCIVGSATSQRNGDNLSQFDRDDFDLPQAFKTFDKESLVKSAVGSKRVKQIVVPHDSALVSQGQIRCNDGQKRTLQTQGGNRPQADIQIAAGFHQRFESSPDCNLGSVNTFINSRNNQRVLSQPGQTEESIYSNQDQSPSKAKPYHLALQKLQYSKKDKFASANSSQYKFSQSSQPERTILEAKRRSDFLNQTQPVLRSRQLRANLAMTQQPKGMNIFNKLSGKVSEHPSNIITTSRFSQDSTHSQHKSQSPSRKNAFCCRIPCVHDYVPPYYNPQNMNERTGLGSKAPAEKIYNHKTQSLQPVPRDDKSKRTKIRLKHFVRPIQKELDKCKVYLHDSRQTASKKAKSPQNVQKMVLEQNESLLQNKVNRGGGSMGQRNRFDKFYLQHFMSNNTSMVMDGQATAVAVMSYNNSGLIQSGDINKRGLHSSQIRQEPAVQMNLFMHQQSK